ncbi:TBCD protein [Lactarius psammicola]|nr:TBCD protein [Lactarius psammicola]
MEAEGEPRILSRFKKYDVFVALQSEALSLDDRPQASEERARTQTNLMWNIFKIFAEYQEQSYLLDPYLEELVTPVVNKFKFYAQSLADGDVGLEDIATFAPELFSAPLTRVSYLLYNYCKFRGYKTIIRFFPHEITDLAVALKFAQVLDRAQSSSSLWPIQYASLLWISLICMIPFDLAQFDEGGKEGQTAVAIEAVAKRGLTNSGIVREGAAVLLSRLYVRRDMLPRLPEILHWAKTCAGEQNDIFECLGVYQTLCEIVKNNSSDILLQFIPDLFETARSLQPDSTLCTNASIRKLRIKLLSRTALCLLPAKPRVSLQRGRVLSARNEPEHSTSDSDDGSDVPEEIEVVLEELFRSLTGQSKLSEDTVVRWSAAKSVARISERLPAEFTQQVVDTVIGLFSVHSIAIASLYDMPAIAESTWHGACLSCAEFLRRGLIANDQLADAITLDDQSECALYFDIRKGAHSIGSNVRDAATNLVSVSTYDREISIRRAASAAFQEYVGRTGIFPHGIDVLGKIDFFAVGIRRNAFLVAAPQVASHEEYRHFLIDHLLTITLRHWDSAMRQLGAQSLRELCEPDLSRLGTSMRPPDVHGGLLALIQLSEAFYGSAKLEVFRQEAFSFLADVPVDMIRSPRNELVTAAACQLIASSVSLKEILLEGLSSVPHWRSVIDLGLKHRKSTVQEAAAAALAAVSKLVDCSSIVQRYNTNHYGNTFIREFRSGSPTMQQSLARLLGLIDYKSHPHSLPEAIDCLVASVVPSSEMRMVDVEARKNCMVSIQIILTSLAPHPPRSLAPDQVTRMYNALILGLDDYTTDERGDVGSRVRIASIQGLASVSSTLLTLVKSDTAYFEFIPADLYQEAIAGILKQGVERLDSVRQQAGESIIRLLKCPAAFHGEQLFEELLLRDIPGDDAPRGSHGWQDSAWIFPRAMNFLEIPEYRHAVLAGLLISVGSKTDSTQRHVRNSIVTYAKRIPVKANNGGRSYSLHAFVTDLITEAKSNLSKNNKVIPVLQVFNVLLETDALERLFESKDGTNSVQALFSIASKGVPKLKSVHRIQECMKTLVNLLAIPQVSESCVPRLLDFLTHEYPTV